MPWKKQVKILYARDGDYIYQHILDAFADSSEVEVNDDPNEIPETHQAAVGVFILTDEAQKDIQLAKSLKQLIKNKFPFFAVVEDIDNFDFSKIPPSIKIFSKLNSVGWDEGSQKGEKALITIKQYLGLISFKENRKVFISYSRSDEDVAKEVTKSLQKKNYWAFLDTENIAGGQYVQQTIMKAISDRDLVLLIDSPAAAKSKWVEKEIVEALNRRITVCALRLQEKQYFPLYQEMPCMMWKRSDRRRFKRLESFISGIISSKDAFDLRCERTIREIADYFKCNIHRVQKRKLRLSKQVNSDQRNLLIEYEDAPHSLDRLYRLYLNYKRSSNLSSAIFVHNRLPLLGLGQKAVEWAAGNDPLHALALIEIYEAVKFTMEA